MSSDPLGMSTIFSCCMKQIGLLLSIALGLVLPIISATLVSDRLRQLLDMPHKAQVSASSPTMTSSMGLERLLRARRPMGTVWSSIRPASESRNEVPCIDHSDRLRIGSHERFSAIPSQADS